VFVVIVVMQMSNASCREDGQRHQHSWVILNGLHYCAEYCHLSVFGAVEEVAVEPQWVAGSTRFPWLPPSLCCKLVTVSMLYSIEAHAKWPVYPDVFDHTPPPLASRCPVLSDVIPVDITAQWREDWLSA